MKKLIIAAAMIVAVATSAFAEGSKVSNRVKAHFDTEFNSASNVSWTTGSEFVKATFILNEQRMEAFYDNDGELIGTSRATSFDNLPAKATKSINKKYGSYKVEEVIEFDSVKDGLSYYVAVSNENTRVVLRVLADGETSLYKKTSK